MVTGKYLLGLTHLLCCLPQSFIQYLSPQYLSCNRKSWVQKERQDETINVGRILEILICQRSSGNNEYC